MLEPRIRDGSASFSSAILAKMARLAPRGRCMCRFRFHETESALYVRVMSLTPMFVCHGWLVYISLAAGRLILSCKLECCNLALRFILFSACLQCMMRRASLPAVTTLSLCVFYFTWGTMCGARLVLIMEHWFRELALLLHWLHLINCNTSNAYRQFCPYVSSLLYKIKYHYVISIYSLLV